VLQKYLADMDDDELTAPIPDIDLNLNFDREGRFTGFAGCNTFSGRYVTDGIQIIYKDILATQLICDQPAGLMDQEARYLQWLDRTEEYRLVDNGKSLKLIVYVFENNQLVEKVLLQFFDSRAGPQ
jgi:heat shock protein HslJ